MSLGRKFVNIIIPKDSTQKSITTSLNLEFEYNTTTGSVTKFFYYNKDMTSLINKDTSKPVTYDSGNNTLSNLLFTWLPTYTFEQYDIMRSVFGYLIKDNNWYGVSYIDFSQNFSKITSNDSDKNLIFEFNTTREIKISDDNLPKYINIPLTYQVFPSLDYFNKQDLLNTPICLKFFNRVNGELYDLEWYNPNSKVYENIWHLVLGKPVFDQSNPNNPTLSVVYLSSKPFYGEAPPSNIELMEKIFGSISSNTNQDNVQPVGLVLLYSIYNSVDFYAINIDGEYIDGDDYKVKFNADIKITDIEIQCSPKYVNITLTNQVNSNSRLASQQPSLNKEIFFKFFYRENGQLSDLEWFDNDINQYVNITCLLYDSESINVDPKLPFPPIFDETELTPVFLSWLPDYNNSKASLMQKIFGNITNNNKLSIEEPVGFVSFSNSDNPVYLNALNTTNGDPIPDYKVQFDATIPITDNDTYCFSEGTKILSLSNQQHIDGCLTSQLKEEYRLVQDLIIGDYVKTYLHGYRKVSRIISGNFVNNPKDEGVANCMYRMIKTEDNGLIEDLTLTRNHGVLVEKLTENEEKKVDKNNLPVIDNLLSIITADSDKFEKVLDNNVYKYYHFSLNGDGDEDRQFGVYANGILVEVPSNNMMDNVLNVKPLDF
jgi:hypothetical protein